MAASLENKSEHPLGKAISDLAIERGYVFKKVENFQSITGQGVRGKIEEKDIIIGTLFFLKKNKIDIIQKNESILTKVYIAIDNIYEGIITLDDEIKKGAKDTIDELKEKGMEIVMVTGDGKRVSEAIGKKIGIEKIYSEVSPKDKAEIIKKLKKNNGFVAMVGDGINDAPALANADVAFAIPFAASGKLSPELASACMALSSISVVLNSLSLKRFKVNK